MGTSFKRALLGVAIVVGLMIAAGGAVHIFYPADWRAVEATVREARVESTRPGTPQWSLIVDSTYNAAGRTFETTSDVFRDRDRAVTEAELANWSAGRTFTLYVNADDPRSSSLDADGGREATTVVAVMLTPLFLMLAGFAVYVVSRVRAGREEAA